MKRFATSLTVLILLAVLATTAQADVFNMGGGLTSLEWVTVGDPGNDPDTRYDTGYGAVADLYRIGKYEVTNAQYAEFLDAVADEDTNGLYNTNMGFEVLSGGITRSGTSPNYSYLVTPNMGNKPVNWVSWYDSLRFANWLHNGQPTGAQGPSTTEDGAYTMIAETYPSGPLITRNAGAEVWLPSEDEWYKAAHYEPGAGTNGYWEYATRSDSAPNVAHADAVGNVDGYYDSGNSGSWTPDGANVANYNRGADWNLLNGNVTTVGSAGALSEGYYGTADMNGNLFEWNETIKDGSLRGHRGGAWIGTAIHLQAASSGDKYDPAGEYDHVGPLALPRDPPGDLYDRAAGELRPPAQ